ncbi:MAG: alkaline phosphatase D family protein [Pseudomonadota bacterium]
MGFSRRKALQGFAAVGATSLLARAHAATQWHSADNPFRLGVASGFPTDESVVLWTRVAPDPLAPDGGMPPADIELQWEIAEDERFRRGLLRGTAIAAANFAHSARVEVAGLLPARHYWYRFTAGGQRSANGRTRTLPAAGSRVVELHLAVACCQHYEHGHYAALKYLAADAPDAIVHLGDYIYEGAPLHNRVRAHVGNLCQTLDDYRLRYSQYQLDPSLQAAHAAAPWLCTWDDHEVANDYSGRNSGRNEDPAQFLARRAAAYQAYFEHLPLPPSATPRGNETPIFARRRVGSLAIIHLLDQRQYRSPQACARPGRAGGNRSDSSCTDLTLADRTMLGAAQENWFDEGLAGDPATWTFIAQGTVMSHLDEKSGDGRAYSTDSWSGYPAARARLLATLQQRRAANPVILSGDLHAFLAGSINAVPEQLDTPAVASEFVVGAISSDPRPQDQLDGWRVENPNLQIAKGAQGYLSLRVSPKRLHADLIAIDEVDDPYSSRHKLHSCVVEAGTSRIEVA